MLWRVNLRTFYWPLEVKLISPPAPPFAVDKKSIHAMSFIPPAVPLTSTCQEELLPEPQQFKTRDFAPLVLGGASLRRRVAAPSRAALFQPNSATAWFDAGEDVYRKARGICPGPTGDAQFLAEQNEAFQWSMQRFAQPSGPYILTPLTTVEIPGSLEAAASVYFGGPLSGIYLASAPTVLIGVYRPTVIRKNLRVSALSGVPQNFCTALIAQHEIYLFPALPAVFQGVFGPASTATIPGPVSPQEFIGLDLNTLSMPLVAYGYIQLYGEAFDECGEAAYAEINFRYQDLMDFTISGNPNSVSTNGILDESLTVTFPIGPFETGIVGGVTADLRSKDLSNNNWVGTMTYNLSQTLEGNITSSVVGNQPAVANGWFLDTTLALQFSFPPTLKECPCLVEDPCPHKRDCQAAC